MSAQDWRSEGGRTSYSVRVRDLVVTAHYPDQGLAPHGYVWIVVAVDEEAFDLAQVLRCRTLTVDGQPRPTYGGALVPEAVGGLGYVDLPYLVPVPWDGWTSIECSFAAVEVCYIDGRVPAAADPEATRIELQMGDPSSLTWEDSVSGVVAPCCCRHRDPAMKLG